RNSILELLSKKFDAPAENIKIKSIKGNFGANNFSIEANIYSSKQEKDIVELKKKKEGGAAPKKEPVAEKPAAAAQ
ncbi:MAG: hypothetical protein NTW17_00985, partial [Candidatus Pacearchaeota archaeon]|nr:hypothetical protein [Candidatus Pacearchaeota archaeon]